MRQYSMMIFDTEWISSCVYSPMNNTITNDQIIGRMEREDDVYQCMERKKYYEALGFMAKLRKPVDEFFDGAEILVKDDQALRENRVGLLQELAGLFLSVADLSRFSI